MYQQIILVGNLGSDPEMRYLPDGTAVTNFSLATNRKWKDGRTGQMQEETTWWRISVFGAQAEACNQYLGKGRSVLVEGRLRPGDNGSPRVWQRQDGTWGASYELTATTVRFLGGRQDGSAMGSYPSTPDAGDTEDADGIPF